MDERDAALREANMATIAPLQSTDESPSMPDRRKARPFSLLSYNPVLPQLSSSPSPHPSDAHLRHASFSSATRIHPLPTAGTTSKRPSRWALIIVPPALLPHSPPPPHVSGFAQGYGPSGRYSTGLILPLQPTLTLQLTSIAREFSLPSTGGLTLHLSISPADQPSVPGPRVTDESWSVLFSWTFDDCPPPYAGLQPSIGLPIAGRLEFDIDLKKARWFDAWAASGQTANRLASQVPFPLKIPSPYSTPGANRAPDSSLCSSTFPLATGTSSIALPRRRNSQFSITYDTSREIPKQLPITISEYHEGGSSTPNKPHDFAENGLPGSSERSRQQLERLVESEDPTLAEENNWHIQQENMLRQAAIEREQIELADRLEEERRIEEEMNSLKKTLLQSNQQIRQNHIDQSTPQTLLLSYTPDGRITETKIEPTSIEQRVDSGSKITHTNCPESSRSTGFVNGLRQNESVKTSAGSVVEITQNMTSSRESQDGAEMIESIRPVGASQETTALKELDLKTTKPEAELVQGIRPSISDSPGTSYSQGERSNAPSSTEALSLKSESMMKEHGDIESSGLMQSEPKQDAAAHTHISSDSRPSIQDHLMSSNIKSVPIEEDRIKHRSEPSFYQKVAESGSPPFSATLGRSVNRFSGEQELVKRRIKTEQGDEEKQKLDDEINRLVNEKAIAKEASILSNPKKNVTHDIIPPVKATIKSPPPPPTRSKVVQLAKAFGPFEARSPTSAQRSPRSEAPSRDNSPAIPAVPVLPSASEPELGFRSRPPIVQGNSSTSPANPSVPLPLSKLEPDFRSFPPVVRGVSLTSPTLPSVPFPLSNSEPKPDFHPLSPVIQGPFTSPAILSASPPAASEVQSELRHRPSTVQRDSLRSSVTKSTAPSVPSSPSTRALSLFKPRLSSGSNFLSNIFRSASTTNAIDFNAIAADPLAPLLHCCENTSSLSEQLANHIIRAQNQALERHQKFVVSISGASLPKLLASGLLENPDVKWDTWKVFFADEKMVPLDHSDSNFANSMEALFQKAPIDRSQLVSILGLPSDDVDLDEMGPLVSSIYMAQVLEELDPSLDGGELPRFDLILLEVGEDGHTCSLFPSHRLLEDQTIIGWCNDSVNPPTHRITMTLPVLNAAYDLAFVCIGSNKDEILRSILEQEPSPTRPASLIILPHKPVVWFVDEAAAAKTQYPRTIQESNTSGQVELIAKDLATHHQSDEHRNMNGLQLEGMTLPMAPAAIIGTKDTQITSEPVCKSEEQPNGLLFAGTRNDVDMSGNELGYPYNLQIYPGVYPHVHQLLYCPVVPRISHGFFLSQEDLSRQMVTEVIDRCSNSTQAEHETIEFVRESVGRTVDFPSAGRDYPFNLNIYPFVYPHLEDKLYGHSPCNGPILPPITAAALLSTMVSLISNDVEDLYVEKSLGVEDMNAQKSSDGEVLDGGQKAEPNLDRSHIDGHGVMNSIQYPYNLTVYPPVYPHLAGILYPELGPLCAAHTVKLQVAHVVRQPKPIPAPLSTFSSQLTQSRGIILGGSIELESHTTDPNIDQFEVTKSPVAVAPTTLTEAFHSPIRSSKVTSDTRVFAPSLPYTQRAIDNELVGVVSPLALLAAPSTLDQSYYYPSIPLGLQSQKNHAGSSLQLALSPVQVLPSELAESFYRDDIGEPSKIQHLIPSPVPSTRLIIAQNQAARASPIPAAALHAPTSALNDGFFASAAAQGPSAEVPHVQLDETISAEDLLKNQQENDRQDGVDRHSEGSYSHFSKGDSINTLHQSTDDDWPPTPHSSDRVSSPNSANGLVMSPPLVREADASGPIKFQFSGPKSPPVIVDQSLSALIGSDQGVSIPPVSQATMLSRTVSQSRDGSMIVVTNGSGSQSNASDLPAQSTPRASVVQSSSSFIMSTPLESDQQVAKPSISETSLLHPSIDQYQNSAIQVSVDIDSQSQDNSEHLVESTPRASIQLRLELTDLACGTNNETPSTSGLRSLDCQPQASQNDHMAPNGLGIDLGQPAVEETQSGSSNEVVAHRQLSNLETTETLTEEKLIHSSDRFECQITPLDKLAEITWAKPLGDPPSPSRLPSPSLIDRLILTPGSPRSIDKQFPGYEAQLTDVDMKAFTPPVTIEVARDCPQISLSAVVFASPPRSPPTPLHSFLPQPSTGSQKESASSVHSNSSDEDARSLVLDDETTNTILVSDGDCPGSPFFLDQRPNVSGLDDASENIFPPTSPIHAISVDGAGPNHSPGRVGIESSVPISYDSQMDSVSLPPLNLAIDLSDPLSAASTAHLYGYDTPRSVTDDEPEQTFSEQSMFGDQSNGINLDDVLEPSGFSLSANNSEELVTELTANVSESLPSITKRAPTPASDDIGIALEPVSIEESAPSPPPILLPFQDLGELSEALAQFIFEAQEVAFQRHGKFQLALGGLVLPQILGAELVGDDRMQWDKWEVFLVEEAIAPLESAESVLSAITKSIIQHVPIPRAQVHSIAELTKADLIETAAIPEGLDSLADSLADEYENKLLELFPEASHETAQPPEFDLILISVGEEGQVGSLYPSHPMLGESNWFVAWLGDAWEPPSHRITLTLPVLNAARQFAFLAIGQELAEIVADGLDRSIQSDVPMDEDRVNPTALVKSSNFKPVVWFTDFAAASLTDYPKSTFWDEP